MREKHFDKRDETMRERDFSGSRHDKKEFQMKKLIVCLFLVLLVSFAFSETGQIHMIYTNGSLNVGENSSTYEFDVQAYMTEGSDVIGDGMVYVKYPANIFGELVSMNNKVTVQKTGILSGTIADYGIDLYRLVNITDTYSNVFAVTFSSCTNSASNKQYFNSISSNPSAPSDLLHITMDISTLDEGSLSFPTSIPGIDMLFYDYELETFSGGLELSQANEAIVYNNTEPEEPNIEPDVEPEEEPVFTGSVELNKFTAASKKGIVKLAWTVESETNLLEYVLERSENLMDYNEISRVSIKSSHNNKNTYRANDLMVLSGISYTYRLLAVDENGISQAIGTKSISVSANRKNILETEEFALEASYPNPFNPSFTVPFSIQTTQDVDIRLYNMSGEVVATVANGHYSPGEYKIHVSGDNLASGVYLLRAKVNGEQATQKMLLVK